MGTGLIVAFVVTVWAAYFVPLALRRYDEAHNNSALEVLTPLSRVIRRSSARDVAAVEVDDVDDVEDSVEAAEDASAPVVRAPRAARAGHTRTTARVAARRRRRVLLTLLGANVIVGVLLAFQVVPVWSIAIPAALLVAWLVACRVQVRHEYGIVTERAVRMPSISLKSIKPRMAHVVRLSTSAAVEEDTVQVSGQLEDVEPDRKHIMENVPLEADALDEQLVIAVPSAASHGAMVWDPLPVTLPTYVTKPRAGRTVRTIDFDAPGVWTSGHVEGEETELPAAASEDSAADGQRRAAGE
ncbi:MAG: hypothetical protein ACJ71Z_06200 [Aeromicrobium sp.]